MTAQQQLSAYPKNQKINVLVWFPLIITNVPARGKQNLSDDLLLEVREWVFIDISIKDELFIPNWEEVKNES